MLSYWANYKYGKYIACVKSLLICHFVRFSVEDSECLEVCELWWGRKANTLNWNEVTRQKDIIYSSRDLMFKKKVYLYNKINNNIVSVNVRSILKREEQCLNFVTKDSVVC